MGVAYYKILDLNILAKIQDFMPYLYDKRDGWKIDNDNILMDRVMGYEESSIGNTDMLDKIIEITEDEAEKLIMSM